MDDHEDEKELIAHRTTAGGSMSDQKPPEGWGWIGWLSLAAGIFIFLILVWAAIGPNG